jgi:biopolymer transport protein ExbB
MNSCAKTGLALFFVLCCTAAFGSGAFAAERRPPEPGPEESGPVIDFNRMLREVEALRRFSSAEAEAALQEMARDRQALTAGIRSLRAEKAATEKAVIAMQAEYNRQIARLDELEAIEKEDLASRKALEGATRMTAGAIRERLAVVPYASVQPEAGEVITRIIGSGSFPAQEDVRAVIDLLFTELEHISRVSIMPGKVTLSDGGQEEAEILRVGAMLAAAHTAGGRYLYLQPVDGGKRLLQAQADIPSSATRLVEKAFAQGATAFPVDFSEGAVFKRFIGQKGFVEHILAGGLLIWPILVLGLAAFVFGLWRYLKLLGVRFGNQDLLGEFFHLVRGGKLEGAGKLLEANRQPGVPVYAVLSHMLSEWAEGNIASMEKCRDEAIMGQLTPLEKGVAFIAVAAAVAPLLGLLGTVTGMISTFEVITIFGNSDPKLLSGGISVALVTTELGLCVAIPLMLLHFMLSRRVATLADDMEEKGAVLIARASAGQSA